MDVATPDDLAQIEKSRTYPQSYDAVWAAVVKTLATQGVSIQSQNKASGNISTDWILEREAIEIFTTGSRFKATIHVEKQSESSRVLQHPQLSRSESPIRRIGNRQIGERTNDLEKRFFNDIQNNL